MYYSILVLSMEYFICKSKKLLPKQAGVKIMTASAYNRFLFVLLCHLKIFKRKNNQEQTKGVSVPVFSLRIAINTKKLFLLQSVLC